MEEEIEMAQSWLHDQDLLDNPNGKELPPDWALCRLWVLFKCQFGDTVDETMQHAFLCHLLPCEDKLAAVQIDLRWVWDPKFYYYLNLTNKVPIRVELPHLCPNKEAWLDIHLDELVAKGVIGTILLGKQPWCITLLLLAPGIQSRQPYWVCENIVPVNK